MRKKIIQNILLFLLLISPFISRYVVTCDTDSKGLYAYVDDTEIGENDDCSDSNGVCFSESIGYLIYHQLGLNCIFSSNNLSLGSYFPTIQEIYLGLTTPPPKHLFR